jgi:uncharacterized damage-inducible protein DinB
VKKHLHQLTSYNLWANSIMSELIENLPTEKLHQTIDSSFNSIFKTLLHIWDAEYIWLKRLQGISISEWPSKMMDKDGFSTNLFLQNTSDLSDFIGDKPINYFLESCEYSNLKGEKFSTLPEGIIAHVVNHSTYHRGQLVTMLRQLGIAQIPSTDFINYLRNSEKK